MKGDASGANRGIVNRFLGGQGIGFDGARRFGRSAAREWASEQATQGLADGVGPSGRRADWG